MTEIEKLLAMEDIKQTKARYFRGMDTKDWAMFEAVFTPDAQIDSSEAFTTTDRTGAPLPVDGKAPPAPNPEWLVKGAAAFVAQLRPTLEGVVTTHHGHMPEITFTSDTSAEVIWAMEDMLLWPAGSPIRTLHAYGHYHETYEKHDGRWLIAAMKLTRLRVDTTH